MTVIEDSTAARLEQALRAAGLDRAKLASSAGVRPAEVGRWLKGIGKPTEFQLDALAIALGVSSDWLAQGIGPMRAAALPTESVRHVARPVRDVRPAPRDGGRDFGNANVWSFNPGPEFWCRGDPELPRRRRANPTAGSR